MLSRRVVVTGLGVVSPLGTGVSHFWDNLLQGKCGIVNLKALYDQQQLLQQGGVTLETTQRWDQGDLAKLSSLPSTVAALVQSGSKTKGLFDPKEWLTAKVSLVIEQEEQGRRRRC